jgi:hypothetical protein
MAQRIFTDGVETSDGGVAGLDPQLLKNIDTGVWETAQIGEEYFSPDQCGGRYGKIVRQYFADTITTEGEQTLVSESTWDKIISYGGYKKTDSTGTVIAVAGGYNTDNFTAIQRNGGTGDVIFHLGEVFDDVDDSYEIWVDYVLETEPTLSPSSRVMPTTDPTVLQRVDDMTWEAPQAGVYYFSPEKQIGGLWRKYFTGSTIYNDLNGQDIDPYCYLAVSSGGFCLRYSPNENYVFPDNDHADIRTGKFVIATGVNGPYTVWVDFAPNGTGLAAYPNTRPTGQPFADPNSPLIKRADTGQWVIPDTTEAQYVDTPKARRILWDLGMALQDDGVTWTLASAVDGTEMELSVMNKQVLWNAGKYQRTDDDTWETVQASSGTTVNEYWSSPKDVKVFGAIVPARFISIFTFTTGAAGSAELVTANAGNVRLLHYDGYLYLSGTKCIRVGEYNPTDGFTRIVGNATSGKWVIESSGSCNNASGGSLTIYYHVIS